MKLRKKNGSTIAHDMLVIGASAGGVEALKMLVAGLPANLKASLFIVMHIPPNLPSTLPTILNRSGPLQAVHATEGMRIEQGKIYVAPPDHHLLLEQGYVHLGSGPKERYVRPAADVLFRSAAHAYGSRVVGIILTGMDSDGTAGLYVVKQYGGVTIIQDPTEAAWPSMPQSALEHVEIDYILPLARLVPLLINLVESSP